MVANDPLGHWERECHLLMAQTGQLDELPTSTWFFSEAAAPKHAFIRTFGIHPFPRHVV